MEHTYLEKNDLNNIKREHFINQMSDEGEKQKARKFFTPGQGTENETDCNYSDADSFRQGSCQLFALALHDTFEYPVFQLSFDSFHHWFCKTIKENKQYYNDVRGITNDFCKFLSTLNFFPFLSMIVSSIILSRIDQEIMSTFINLGLNLQNGLSNAINAFMTLTIIPCWIISHL